MVRLMSIYFQLSKTAEVNFKGIRAYRKRSFLDSLRIFVKGGVGGMGYPKFGGVGGKGGDVYVIAAKKATLRDIFRESSSKRFIAGNGGNSRLYRVLGELGKDVVIPCPVGVTIYNDEGHKFGELNKPGERVLVAKGGCGGSPANQYNGQLGQAHSVKLFLKLIADVGLVGYPNAGKSSLLKAISRASPRIANYPFTTISPQLGVVKYDDLRQISVADLPGLIEGAHINVGLGHHFLRHIERTKLLMFVVDINGFQLSPMHTPRTAFESVALLTKELELYREDLLDKPAILVVNKMDTENADGLLPGFMKQLQNSADAVADWPENLRPKKFVHFDEIISISATKGNNVTLLKEKIRSVIDLNAELNREDEVVIKDVEILVKRQPSVKLV